MTDNVDPYPISITRECLSLSQIEVEKIIHLFLDSHTNITKSYCSKCHFWECTFETIDGLVCFNVNLFGCEKPNEIIVEFQRISGSSLIFSSIFREFKLKREEGLFPQVSENILEKDNVNNDNNNKNDEDEEEKDGNHSENSSDLRIKLQIQDPPPLTSQESEKAIEALRCWLSFDPLEASNAIGCLQDPDISSLPSFKLLKMEAIREKNEINDGENEIRKISHYDHILLEGNSSVCSDKNNESNTNHKIETNE